MRNSNLIVHTGGFEATRDQVVSVPVPEATEEQTRWKPVPYRKFLEFIEQSCRDNAVPLAWPQARYALAREGMQLFGTVPISLLAPDAREIGLDLAGDWSPQIGFRQSYDSSMSAGLVLGHRVFICDNLAFCGEFKIEAKNTLEVMEILPQRLSLGAGKIIHWSEGIVAEVKLMKKIHPSPWEIDNIIVDSVRKGIMPGSKMSQVIGEIEKPSYDYNGSKASLWQVFNAFTVVQRDRSPAQQFKTGTPLLSLFREHGLRERRAELTTRQRHALEEMERETAEVLSE